MNPIKSLALLVVAHCTLATGALALPTDRDQPIHVDADSADLNQKAGILTYTGNVVIDQGSIHIEADKAVIYSKNSQVYKVLATGVPAHFQQRPEADKELVKARGNSLVYDVGNERLTITDNARVEQNGSVITGGLINYDIHLAIVEAGSRSDKSERVKVILQPQPKKPAAEEVE